MQSIIYFDILSTSKVSEWFCFSPVIDLVSLLHIKSIYLRNKEYLINTLIFDIDQIITC